MPAPIALFAYNRPTHLGLVIKSLLSNPEAKFSDLFLFLDGANSEKDIPLVNSVREVANGILGFRSIKIRSQSSNLGLSKSITAGVTEVVQDYGKVIVLEDDLFVSPFFLKYMNEALELYENDHQVAAIHGYLLPIDAEVPETFFLKGADCWGWATWSSKWGCYNPDGASLLAELKLRNSVSEFNLDGHYPYFKMLENQVRGLNQSWAIRWQASVFLKGMVTLYPRYSLVKNIGNDNSGVHCNATNDFDVELSTRPIKVYRIPIAESLVALNAIKLFYKRTRWLPRRLIRYLLNVARNYSQLL